MPITLYADGSLYGDADAIYGRISSEMAAAQETFVRETGLIVQVIDQRLNQWELWSEGDPLNNDYHGNNGGAHPYEQTFYSYRGAASICVLDNGTIVRVRLGSPGNVSDRAIYVQEITDPLTPANWESWNLLYSGTHFSVTVVPETASTYSVYHAKTAGMFKNNSSIWAVPDFFLRFESAGPLNPDQGFAQFLLHDVTSNPTVTRTVGHYYFDDIDTFSGFDEDPENYRWFRNAIGCLALDDGRMVKIQTLPYFFSPRSDRAGYAVFAQFKEPGFGNWTTPYLLRGIGGGGGKNWYSTPRITKLSDGYYYMSMGESHQAADSIAPLADESQFRVWSRSKDLLHWSEPVLGPEGQKHAGIIEHSGYVWWANNAEVYRRPAEAVTYDISDYVPEASLELPRDNQASTGTITVANPDGVNDNLLELADQEIIVKPGIKVNTTGLYEYQAFDRFWVKQANQSVEGKVNRITLTIGNVMDRLDNKFKDVYNFVGQTEWDDWEDGRRNQPFNYFFNTDTAPTVDNKHRLYTRGIVLWTGWKGHNWDFTVRLSSITGDWQIIGHYQDKKNYLYLKYGGADEIWLEEMVDGEVNHLTEFFVSGAINNTVFNLRWRQKWRSTQIWYNGEDLGDDDVDFENYKPGYVGFKAGRYKVSKFHFKDLEYPLTMANLIKTALALGDVHDVIVGGGISKAYAIIWGPQTDIPTPMDGLRTAMESDKLQLVWRNGSVEIGKFNETDIVKTIENRLISSEKTEEPARRINYSIVDGNEHSWIAFDRPDTLQRGRSVVEYQDLPELLKLVDVKERAREAIRKSTMGASPTGTMPLYFDLWRMDHVLWKDNVGGDEVVRIEGMTIELRQDQQPSQRVTLDTSLIAAEPTEIVIEEIIPEEEQPIPDDPE